MTDKKEPQLLGIGTEYIDQNDGKITRKHSQIITDAFIDDLRDSRVNSHNKFQREGETMRVASIPVVIHEKWLREGFDLFKEPHKKVIAKLKAENLDAFIATDKRL